MKVGRLNLVVLYIEAALVGAPATILLVGPLVVAFSVGVEKFFEYKIPWGELFVIYSISIGGLIGVMCYWASLLYARAFKIVKFGKFIMVFGLCACIFTMMCILYIFDINYLPIWLYVLSWLFALSALHLCITVIFLPDSRI